MSNINSQRASHIAASSRTQRFTRVSQAHLLGICDGCGDEDVLLTDCASPPVAVGVCLCAACLTAPENHRQPPSTTANDGKREA